MQKRNDAICIQFYSQGKNTAGNDLATSVRPISLGNYWHVEIPTMLKLYGPQKILACLHG